MNLQPGLDDVNKFQTVMFCIMNVFTSISFPTKRVSIYDNQKRIDIAFNNT